MKFKSCMKIFNIKLEIRSAKTRTVIVQRPSTSSQKMAMLTLRNTLKQKKKKYT